MKRTMLTCTGAAALLLLGVAAPAAAQDADELRRRRAAKVEEAWFTRNPWTDDFDVAKERARERGKVIFAYFTRSYAG
ncbi:MAG: thioredoxin family protein [Planctomycetes bacterium]|nr:thioredoxin family protein [Planctomycetota bacterium]